MANALMDMATPDTSNPWAWNQLAQTQDPGLYGFKDSRGLTIEDLRLLRPMLVQSGKWNQAWDAALDDPAYYSSQQEGESGMLGQAASKQLDLSGLNGYTVAGARGPDNIGLTAYRDPQGNMIHGRAEEAGHSMRGRDYGEAALLVGGTLAAGAGIGALAGGGVGAGGVGAGAGVGAGGAAAGGMTAAEQVAFLAANGMSDAAIAAAYPGLASSAGLTGVGGGVAGAAAAGGLPDVPAYDGSGGWEALNVGAAPAEGAPAWNAALADSAVGTGGYGASSAGAGGGATASWGAGAGYAADAAGSSLGSQLGDFFSGNGNLGDYGRVAQGLVGLYGQNRASNAAQAGAAQQNALLREMWQANQQQNQPLLDLRNATLPRINALMSDPSSVAKEPGYQFGLNQGQAQIDNQAAARGGYYSGQQLKASQKFGQDYAGTKLDQSLNRLMGVAGLGQVGAAANQTNNVNFGNAGGNGLANAGNIRGSGYLGMGNTAANTIGDLTNDWVNRKTWGGGW